MQAIKRQKINDEDDDHVQWKKFYEETVKSITNFEDLSNDIFYEIFEYLDMYDLYQVFYNLNQRFYNLITCSTLPIKINISTISRSQFLQYNKTIITPHQHRIIALNLRNVFSSDLLFSPPRAIKQFIRLQTLILDNINSNLFENFLLDHLTSMSTLRSLVINLIDQVRNKDTFYRTIFRIPQLKYCKLTYTAMYNSNPLPMAMDDQSSTIEHLVVNSDSTLDELVSVLSYLPYLRRFSWHELVRSFYKQPNIARLPLKNLTHLSLTSRQISFEQFQSMIINLFHHVEVLHLTTAHNRDYLDADRWEQLILNYMPNLRIFDFQHRDHALIANEISLTCIRLNTLFTSSFWRTHQWYFNHQCSIENNWVQLIFYSTNPYRRKSYRLYIGTDKHCCLSRQETDLTTIDHVCIEDESALMSCTSYFPNASELMLSYNFDDTIDQTIKHLSRILPLTRLTQLHINCRQLCFNDVIHLLQFMPNLQILSVCPTMLYTMDALSLENSELFKLVSNNNMIKIFTLNVVCTYEQIKSLLKLFSQLQHIKMNICWTDFNSIFELLLFKIDGYPQHLSSLCLTGASGRTVEKLRDLIQSNKWIDNYSIELINTILHLWW